MEIKKFEEKDRLPNIHNICLCFMEQSGAEPNDKFRSRSSS
jgi:hypothetical protein